MVVLALFFWRPPAFPEPSGPKLVTFSWKYDDRPYSLTLTLHQSVYGYYRSEPKGILLGKEEEGLEKYLGLPAEDATIKELAVSISTLAAQNNLSEEQKVELAVAFVQSIPYDDQKAVGEGAQTPRYAYEVLYDNSGICSEKSFLAYTLLREMGYGTAVFAYPNENHMNIGIEAPIEYSTDQTGYSMVETTNRDIKIGIIPDLDPASGRARQIGVLPQFNIGNPGTTAGKNLSSPVVYARTRGRKYSGVVKRFQARRELADIQKFLSAQVTVLDRQEIERDALRRRLDEYRAKNDVRAYNSLVNLYNKQAGELKGLITQYNEQVTRHNALLSDI